MITSKKFYITTAIPYVNAAPHLGHALEFVQTDVVARYHRALGEDVALVTGADENSLKNVHAAQAKGVTTEKLCEENAGEFRKMADKVGLTFTSFLRTSLKKEHFAGAGKLWELCDKKGDIYKKKYRGLYCVGCEAFYEIEELQDGVCPEHRKKLDVVEEENYFFRLSNYEGVLEKLIESDELKIVPQTRKNEVLSFIKSGLKDFSISRSVARAKGWGVPVPNDDKQMMYVWFDALGAYLTGIGYGHDEKKFSHYWPANVHVIGKGIIRFHAVYWPAILLSAGLKLPKELLVHGYITVGGQKMSKSLGNAINPVHLAEKYGVDELRYCLLSEIPTFEDGDFSERALVEKNNSELLANVGNLVNRTLVFTKNNFDGHVPQGKLNENDKAFLEEQKKSHARIGGLLENLKIKDALQEAMMASKNANRYFQDNKPWELVKNHKGRAGTVINLLIHQAKDVAIMLMPFLPGTSEEIFRQLNFKNAGWKDLGYVSISSGHKIGEPKTIFRKLEAGDKRQEAAAPKVTFADFGIEVGEIIHAEKHPNAEKLYVERVKLGDGEVQVVSGIAAHYTLEEIIGRKVFLVRNLAPASIRGVESHGMLLAAENKEKKVELVPATAKVGAKMHTEGTANKPKPQITIDEFFKVKLEVKNHECFADGKRLFAGKEQVKTQHVKDGKIA